MLLSSLISYIRDLDDVLKAGLDQYTYKYYTYVCHHPFQTDTEPLRSIQHYPTYVCSGYNDKTSNISYYISHTNGMFEV